MIRNRMKEHRARLVLAWNIAKVFGVPIEEVFTVEPDGPAEHS